MREPNTDKRIDYTALTRASRHCRVYEMQKPGGVGHVIMSPTIRRNAMQLCLVKAIDESLPSARAREIGFLGSCRQRVSSDQNLTEKQAKWLTDILKRKRTGIESMIREFTQQ